MVVEKVYMFDGERKRLNELFSRAMGHEPVVEQKAIYASRAISTVPEDMKEFLERSFNSFVGILRNVGWDVRIPFEVSNPTELNEINPRNHKHIEECIANCPFMSGVSDGRSWEHVTYIRKAVVPIVYAGQKINIPALIIPFQVSLLFKDFDDDSEAGRFGDFFRGLREYDFGTGRCSSHGDTLVGIKGEVANRKFDCMRCVAEGYGIKVVPTRI